MQKSVGNFKADFQQFSACSIFLNFFTILFWNINNSNSAKKSKTYFFWQKIKKKKKKKKKNHFTIEIA